MVGRFFRGLLVLVAIIIFAGIAAVVFFADPDIRDVELVAKYGQPPSKFITLPSGARVHYRDQGQRSGIPIILLHGSGSSLYAWEPWVAQIGDQFRMISLDLPSHGLTGEVPSGDYSQQGMVDFLDEFTKSIGVERFAIAGNSMGGGVAARFTLGHPERVTHLILVDAAGMPTSVKKDPPLAFVIARTPVLQYSMLFFTPRYAIEDATKAAWHDTSKVTPEMVDRYAELTRRGGNRTATLRRFQSVDDHFIEKNVSNITTPTLIIWGEFDTFTPPDMGKAYNAAIKGSKLVTIRNVGHLPMEEEPGQSARVVREFLAPTPIP